MSFFSKLKAKLTGLTPGGETENSAGRGILLFEHTGEVIRAEKALKAAGFAVAVKAPPPALRTGCDLVIEFPLLMEPAVREVLLVRKLAPLRVYPLSDDVLLEPVSLFQHKDYGAWLMVRAANMKITVDKTCGGSSIFPAAAARMCLIWPRCCWANPWMKPRFR